MQTKNYFLSIFFVLANLNWILARQQPRINRHTTIRHLENSTNGLRSNYSMISSTLTPPVNFTEKYSSTKPTDEWSYGKRSLTTAKIIFISAFAISAGILIIMLIVTVAWNWQTKPRPNTSQTPPEINEVQTPEVKTERI